MSGPVDTTEDQPAGEIVTFVRPERRTYLDAAREQGVYQEREELLAEIATLKAKGYGDAPSATVTPIGGEGSAHATFASAIDQGRADIVARFRDFTEVFQASGLGGPHFPLFVAIAFLTEVEPKSLVPFLEHVRQDHEKTKAAASYGASRHGSFMSAETSR